MGARKRAARRAAAGGPGPYKTPAYRRRLARGIGKLIGVQGERVAIDYQKARAAYRIGERLRPCPGCPDCTGDTKALRRIIERPERVRHWGQYHTIVPAFLPTAIGDGKQWIVLVPLNTRPNYYVCRIDSSHSDKDPDGWLDDLYLALEGYFGRGGADDGEEGEEPAEWPAVDLDCGSCWGDYQWSRCDGSGVLPARPR